MGKSALKPRPAAKIAPRPSRAEARRLEARQQETVRRQNELVAQYLPFATSVANRVAQSLSSSVDYDDVVCNARLGLIEAAQRFDVAQQVDFRTFAYYRIKGAIFDGLRKSGWLPRSLYARLKFEEAANDYLQQRALYHAPVEESAVAEITDTVNSLASIYVLSLDGEEDLEVEDTNQAAVDQRTEFHQVRAHMREAMSVLPPKEQQLVMMYYFQNRTLEEAGERLGLSKSWTSRLHVRALEALLKRIRQLTKGKGEGGDVLPKEE
ncbi:MAG: sigma-70 family RNA polymerase sigma factor [Deltaproteobacteria bacterium]|nr:sigma-70 family RNA polymerase sigma factor [Deltaproteobacteria bacterium]